MSKLFMTRRARRAERDVLPAAEAIGPDDDVSAFLRPEVDAAQRREALRALFRQAKFNHRDGLDDYDEDHRLARTGSRIGPRRQS